jgi:transcription-repair coupling factor (superfamily II helicase)
MPESLPHLLDDSPLLARLHAALESLPPGAPLHVTGVAGSFRALLSVSLHTRLSRQILLIAADKESAIRAADDLAVLADPSRIRLFLGREEQEALLTERSRELHDVHTLRSLLAGEVDVVVTHPAGAALRLPPPVAVQSRARTLNAGASPGFAETVAGLQEFLFERTDIVERPGEYAVRGGILDVFPFVGENPLRVEFVEDTVESIREFDVASQRSIRELSSALLVPDLLAESDNPIPGNASLLDYLHDRAVVVLDEALLVQAAWEQLGTSARAARYDVEKMHEVLTLFPQIHMTGLHAGMEALDFGVRAQPSFNGSIQALMRDITERQDAGIRILLCCDGQAELGRIRELIGTAAESSGEHHPLDQSAISYSLDAIHEGFLLAEQRVAVYTEHQIFGRIKRHGRRRRARFKGITEADVQQLRKGDYIVHEDFGIGKFSGLRTIRVRDVDVEVAAVLYAENDTLYVNIGYLNKLQKYSSKDGHIPKLHRLGSGEWEKLKARTKKRVKDIARDLITLYARRKMTEGFVFPVDTPWQKELEASFMYEDTFDQAKATLDVKRDMEASPPMDRLVCGDVGFGKTEVAVRAAFKAVMSGKQVAVLVPTTILAAQHVQTFRDRMSRYGVDIDVLSRFKVKKEQEAVIARLRDGVLDLVIGTHRLLSKDVSFKDIGLLIIDEEHRFGVAAKEKLRQLRAQVDTLALTATPIPRTLHFSLLGARDLSVIATPPRNRLPIVTEITQWHDELIQDAVRRELRRGGQVYFVHDRVQSMGDVAARLHQLLPDVRIGTAHGQLQPRELEQIMLAFLEKRIDMLVSTKIIESGLDIPNVNTIIINRADRFGMAELYQLRGRVGRSNTQAYAYLLTPPVSVLGRNTVQRLQALQEFNELGSGFNLAMRDLEIRGAGNLLGSEQSGFIEMMGFETYTRILEEAVRELKQEEFQELFKDERATPGTARGFAVEADLEAFIPAMYVENETERLTIYRRLYAVNTHEQLDEIGDELRDRFGKRPPQVETLLGLVRLKLSAGPLGLTKIHLSPERLEAHFPPPSDTLFYESARFQQLMTAFSRMRERGVRVTQGETTLKTTIPFGRKLDPGAVLQKANGFIQELLKMVPEPHPGG